MVPRVQCEKSFLEIKKILSTEPVLQNYDENKELILVTDASTVATSGVLLQPDETKNLRPIAYTSKLLQPSQIFWSSCELELLAVCEGLKAFHDFTYLRPVIVYSDNIALKYFSKVRNGSLRLNKLAVTINSYDIEVRFVRGRMNKMADFLSRNIKGIETLREMNNDSDSEDECDQVILEYEDEEYWEEEFIRG